MWLESNLGAAWQQKYSSAQGQKEWSHGRGQTNSNEGTRACVILLPEWRCPEPQTPISNSNLYDLQVGQLKQGTPNKASELLHSWELGEHCSWYLLCSNDFRKHSCLFKDLIMKKQGLEQGWGRDEASWNRSEHGDGWFSYSMNAAIKCSDKKLHILRLTARIVNNPLPLI